MWGCRSNKDIVCELVNVPPDLLSYSCYVKGDAMECAGHLLLSLRVFNFYWILVTIKCGIVIFLKMVIIKYFLQNKFCCYLWVLYIIECEI